MKQQVRRPSHLEEKCFERLSWCIFYLMIFGSMLSLAWASIPNFLFVACIYLFAILFQNRIFGQKHFDQQRFGAKDLRENRRNGIFAFGSWLDLESESLTENMKLIELSKISYQRLLIIAQVVFVGSYLYLTLKAQTIEFLFPSLLHLAAAIYLMVTTHKGHFFLAIVVNLITVLLSLRSSSSAPPWAYWAGIPYAVLLLHVLVELHDFDLRRVLHGKQTRWQDDVQRIFSKSKTVVFTFGIVALVGTSFWKANREMFRQSIESKKQFAENFVGESFQNFSEHVKNVPENIREALKENPSLSPVSENVKNSLQAWSEEMNHESMNSGTEAIDGESPGPQGSKNKQQALMAQFSKLAEQIETEQKQNSTGALNSGITEKKIGPEKRSIDEAIKSVKEQNYSAAMKELKSLKSSGVNQVVTDELTTEIVALEDDLQKAAAAKLAGPKRKGIRGASDEEILDRMQKISEGLSKRPQDQEGDELASAMNLREIMKDLGKKSYQETLKELKNFQQNAKASESIQKYMQQIDRLSKDIEETAHTELTAKETDQAGSDQKITYDADDPELNDFIHNYAQEAKKIAGIGQAPQNGDRASSVAGGKDKDSASKAMVGNEPNETRVKTESIRTARGQRTGQNRPQKTQTKREFLPKFLDRLKRLIPGLFLFLGLALLIHIYQRLQKPVVDDDSDEERLEISEDDLHQLQEALRKTQREDLSPDELVIKRFHLALELMKKLNFPKPDGLPVEDFPGRFPLKLKVRMSTPFSSLTHIFSDCFYGKFSVSKEHFEVFNSNLKQVFQEANRLKVRIIRERNIAA